MNIVPVVSKIIEQQGIFYGLNAEGEVIFGTEMQEIANMYFAIPAVLEEQARIIKELTDKFNAINEEYNNIVMGMIPSGSNLVH